MITDFPEEFYTIRELRFTMRQMIWIAGYLTTIRLGIWPVKPPNHVETGQREGNYAMSDNKRRSAEKTLKTRPARFERAAQIAAEIDWRLGRCFDNRGNDWGALFLDAYMEGYSFEKTAKRHNLDVDTVSYRIGKVSQYISGWRRKDVNMAEFIGKRKKEGVNK